MIIVSLITIQYTVESLACGLQLTCKKYNYWNINFMTFTFGTLPKGVLVNKCDPSKESLVVVDSVDSVSHC